MKRKAVLGASIWSGIGEEKEGDRKGCDLELHLPSALGFLRLPWGFVFVVVWFRHFRKPATSRATAVEPWVKGHKRFFDEKKVSLSRGTTVLKIQGSIYTSVTSRGGVTVKKSVLYRGGGCP